MKYSILLLLLGLFVALGSSTKSSEVYQVISSHPHDVEELNPYVNTIYQNGRLWVVELNKNAPASVMAHLKPISGREKSYLYRGVKISTVAKTENDTGIRLLLANVDQEAIRKDVEELSNYKSRYTGSPENVEAVEKTIKRFEAMGFKTKKICAPKNKYCSFVADKKGKIETDEVLMVIGHIDSVGADFAGADDNGSGVAVMLEMARVLEGYENQKNIRFFVTNGEEQGLLGAKQYAQELGKSGDIKKISYAVNMDMVGYNSNGIVELETDAKFEALARWQANLAREYTTLKTKITLGAWGSDHVPFIEKDVPTLLTIEDWETKTPCYHQKCDRPDTLNYEYAAEIAKLNLAAIMGRDLNL